MTELALDHVFVLTGPDGGSALSDVASLGLVETRRVKHRGQGTANRCYAFENAYLELLWIEEVDETRSETVAPCRFEERARGDQANPFGISWRGDLELATWPYRPPYIPVGRAIPIAEDSMAIRHPLLFETQGGMPPAQWPPARGPLQRGAGFTTLHVESVRTPESSAALALMLERGLIERLERGPHGITLRFERHEGPALHVALSAGPKRLTALHGT